MPYDTDLTPWSTQSFGDPQALEEARTYRNRLRDRQRESARQAVYKKYGANLREFPNAPTTGVGTRFQQEQELRGLEEPWGQEDAAEVEDYNFTRNRAGVAQTNQMNAREAARRQQAQMENDNRNQQQIADRNTAAQRYYQNWMRQMQAAGNF